MSERENLDRMQDAADIMFIVAVNRRIKLDALKKLGNLIGAGGGARILQAVSDARAERRIDIP
jgi:hypothetical protein